MSGSRAAIGRRTVLRWGVANVAVISVAVGAGSGRAEADTVAGDDGPDLGPTAAGQVTVLVPGSDQNVLAPVDLGLTLVAGAAGLAAGSVAGFEFDPRLYDVDARATAMLGRTPLRTTRGPVDTDPATGRASVTVILDDAIGAGAAVTVIVGRLRSRRYPLDILRDYGDTPATVSGRHAPGQALVRRSRELGSRSRTADSGQPWGVEAGVLWQPITWDGRYRSFCARVATVRSLGPGPAPAGYRVRVLADPSVVRTLHITSATTDDGRRVRGTASDLSTTEVVGLEWTAQSSLPAGELVRLSLSVIPGAPVGALVGIKHPMVEVIGSRAHLATQRTSYLESVVRQDSIYDTESALRFG